MKKCKHPHHRHILYATIKCPDDSFILLQCKDCLLITTVNETWYYFPAASLRLDIDLRKLK